MKTISDFPRRRTLLAWAAILALTACATVPMATSQQDVEAKLFRPVAESGVVYIFRDSPMKGAAIALPVVVNGRMVGASGAKTFMRLVLAPGQHELVSPQGAYVSMTLDIAPGLIYFVRHEPVFEFAVQSISGRFEVTDSAEGRAAVLGCALANGKV